MKFVLASYVLTKEFNEPEAWLKRIRAYVGILEPLSINNTVTSVEQIDHEGEYFKNGVNYHFIKLSKFSRRYFPFKLHRYIKNQQPDIVIIQSLHFPLQLIQLRWTLGSKTKIIVQNHAERPYNGIKKYLQRWADRYVDAYLFASHDLGMDWVNKGKLISAEKIHEVMEISSIFYPVEKANALLKTGANGTPLFLWVGRLNANKDPLNVVNAFLKFTYSCPAATLYMIYHTDELLKEIVEFAKGHPNKNAIHLVGKVPNDDLLYWYNSADFIVSGSHYEGSGTAICEAMSCGCIPVVTDIFSFRMITDNGRCGLLYKAGNEDALLATLKQTQQIDIPEKRKLSLEYFKSNLSFEAIAGQIEKIAASL